MAVDTQKYWQLAERELTSETFFRQRRQLVKSAGLIGLGIASGLISACGPAGDAIRVGVKSNRRQPISIPPAAIYSLPSIVR